MTAPRHMESTEGLTLSVGRRVYSRDGQELGTVKETAETAFKVDVSMSPDYWLTAAHVLNVSVIGVQMDFDHGTLDHYKLDGPDSPASESPMLDAQADTFTSTEDKELRREQNEHPGPA